MTTSEVRFDRKDAPPDDLALKKSLGRVHPAYKEILSLADSYAKEWKFYGAKLGWQLKVSQKGKALFYLVPLDKAFRLGFAVRDLERDVLLSSRLPARAKADLTAAKRYPEGYALRLLVRKATDMRAVRMVIDTLKALRP